MKFFLKRVFNRAFILLLILVAFSAGSLHAQVYEEKEEIVGIASVCELRDNVLKAGKLSMDALRGKQFEREVNKAAIWQSKVSSAMFDKNLTSFGDRDGGYYLGEKQFSTEAEAVIFHDKLLSEIKTCTGVDGFRRYGYQVSYKPLVSVTDWMSDYYKTVSLGDKRFFIISLIRTSENIVRLKIIAHSRSYYMDNVDYYDDNKFLKKAKQFKFKF